MDSTAPAQRAQALLDVVTTHAPTEAVAWLRRGWPQAGPLQRGLLFGFFAGVGRRFGDARPALSESEQARLQAAGVAAPGVPSLSDLARAALLLRALAVLPEEEHVPLVTEAYRKGDSGERIAVLRALHLLPDPGRFLDVGVEACRSHVQDVFEAIACHNPYPAAHFPEAAFNQLVTKAMFTGAPLRQVNDWERRNNPELQRMARDFAAERSAAGRPVPADVGLITGK